MIVLRPYSLATFLSLTVASAMADWRPVATDLVKTVKTGFGGLCGVVVDRRSGDVFINLSDAGIYRSTDKGETWAPTAKEPFKGRTESPGCWLIDPTGKSSTMVSAFVYGVPIAVSENGARTFDHLHAKSDHVDWCAVDWTDPGRRFVIALKHEMGGLLIASGDGGKSFREVGKGYVSGWVFDHQTAVVAHEKAPVLQRTVDGGKTFEPCGEFAPVGRHSSRTLPKWHAGKLYWLTDKGLIATADKGASWRTVADIDGAVYGPISGKEQRHLFVLTRAGVVESMDGGATWSEAIAAPAELAGSGELTWLDYDPINETLYMMKMGSDLYRLERKP